MWRAAVPIAMNAFVVVPIGMTTSVAAVPLRVDSDVGGVEVEVEVEGAKRAEYYLKIATYNVKHILYFHIILM